MSYRNKKNSVLGMDYYGFGEFNCTRCNHHWESAKAWSNYGQKCKNCTENIQPKNMKKLHHYHCIHCNNFWKWKWQDELSCRSCKRMVKPFKDHNEFKEFVQPGNISQAGTGNIDPSKAHKRNLCEKCKHLGYPCWKSAKWDNGSMSEPKRRAKHPQTTSSPRQTSLSHQPQHNRRIAPPESSYQSDCTMFLCCSIL